MMPEPKKIIFYLSQRNLKARLPGVYAYCQDPEEKYISLLTRFLSEQFPNSELDISFKACSIEATGTTENYNTRFQLEWDHLSDAVQGNTYLTYREVHEVDRIVTSSPNLWGKED